MNTSALINQHLPPELFDLAERDAGKGVSNKPEDQLIPLVYILQNNSPVCDKRGPSYLDGAEPGHFYLRGAIDPVRDGTAGISVIYCGMNHVWLEFLPNRQGLVGRHDKPPSDIEARAIPTDGGRERQGLVRSSNNNVLQDTRELFLLVDGAPFVLPCYSTRHSFAKSWMSYFTQFKHPKTGAVMPAFSRKYRLTTTRESNGFGRWFGLKFEDLGWASLAEYQAAHALNEIVERGVQRVELPLNEGADTAPLRTISAA